MHPAIIPHTAVSGTWISVVGFAILLGLGLLMWLTPRPVRQSRRRRIHHTDGPVIAFPVWPARVIHRLRRRPPLLSQHHNTARRLPSHLHRPGSHSGSSGRAPYRKTHS